MPGRGGKGTGKTMTIGMGIEEILKRLDKESDVCMYMVR